MLESLAQQDAAALRRSVYALFIALAAGLIGSQIAAVRSERGTTPLLSANDRSRWCTVRSLVEHGTYAIDDVIYSGGKRNGDWYSIDLVRHRGPDGREHYYSSKPPLLPTLLAGEYWVVKRLTGASLAEEPFYVVRLMLVLTNLLPLTGGFLLLGRAVERWGASDWGRIFVVATATLGTFLSTFAVTLNNHLPAALSTLVAVYCGLRIIWDGCRGPHYFAIAGFFAAFAAANELPALSLLAALGALLLWQSPLKTCAAFVPAVAVVVAAFLLTNYAAHGSLRPPYLHRGDGPVLATVPAATAAELEAGAIPGVVRSALGAAGNSLSEASECRPRAGGGSWLLWDPESEQRWALVRVAEGIQIRSWDNWYDYAGSYWQGEKEGVDRGEPSRAVYLFHMLLGHHGVFSLTPVWLLSLGGIGRLLVRGSGERRQFALLVLVLTVVCVGFYALRPLADRNYGGVCSGFRWLFWLIPLWLLGLLPAADGCAARRGRRHLAVVLLGISAFSAWYAASNPWSQPWLFDYWTTLGWIRY